MTRQRERDPHVAAGIKETEQYALPLAHADGLAMSEHPLAESRGVIHYLQAVVRRRTLADVLHADPRAFPMVGGEHDLAVVSPGITGGWLDDEEAEFSRIGAAGEVAHRHCVTVVPT